MKAMPRSFARRLLLIAAGALAVRLYYALAIAVDVPAGGDAMTYHWLANILADGEGFKSPWHYVLKGEEMPTAEHPPLYPLGLAVFSLVGLDGWNDHRVASCLMGTGTVLLIGLLGRRVAGERAGLVAAAIAGAYPLLITTDGSLYSESLYGLTVALALLAAYRLIDRPGTASALLLGAACGLAALTRSEALLLVPLLVVPVAWLAGGARLRNAVIGCVAFVLVISPWVVRSWAAFDQPVGLTTNLGGVLAGSNCAETYSGEFMGLWRFQCFSEAPEGSEADKAAHWRRQGLDYMREHPGRLALVVPVRVLRVWDLWRPRQQWYYEAVVEGRDLRWQRAGTLSYFLLLPLAVYGLVLLRRRREPLRVLLAPALMVTLSAAAGYGITRLRMAAEVPLVVAAAVAVTALVEQRARGALRARPQRPAAAGSR